VVRLQRIAARTWLRTLDDRLGVSAEVLRRMGPGPALPVRRGADRRQAGAPLPAQPRGRHPRRQPLGLPHGKVPELLYNRGELYNLCIDRGTLTEEDRYKINEHIVQTIRMLSELPFPRTSGPGTRRSPVVTTRRWMAAATPAGLTREQMSPLARMMAIADIFEALTAVDRPYKKGKSLSEAVGIMARMRERAHRPRAVRPVLALRRLSGLRPTASCRRNSTVSH
jgi:hypothetical protein